MDWLSGLSGWHEGGIDGFVGQEGWWAGCWEC